MSEDAETQAPQADEPPPRPHSGIVNKCWNDYKHIAVRQRAVVLDENHTGIDLHFDAGALRLVGQGDDGAARRAELAITHEGEPVTMMLDSRFLIEPVRMLRAQTHIVIEWADANSPLVLRAADGFVNLIMLMTGAA
jgi:hypothetical protein